MLNDYLSRLVSAAGEGFRSHPVRGFSFLVLLLISFGLAGFFLISSSPSGISALKHSHLSLDGTDDYVGIPESDLIPSGGEDYAMTAWFKTPRDEQAGIIGWGDWNSNNQSNALGLAKSGEPDEISLHNYWGNNDLTATTNIKYGNKWHFVVAQFDGTTREIWLDGLLVASDQPDGLNAVVENARIGSTNMGEYFPGYLDNVRIYTRALSETEITNLYGRADISSGLIGCWEFDNLNDNIAIDSSGNDLHGTINRGTYPEYPYPDTDYDEYYRPQFHYSPKHGWMNDINGMFYCNGEYHVMHLHDPHGLSPPGTHLGHATSPDMLHWKQQPIALEPEVNVRTQNVNTGGAVVDKENTSGLQVGDNPVLIAIYTARGPEVEGQSIAYSNDLGDTWKNFPGNPVIPGKYIGSRLLRGPTDNWVMALHGGDGGTSFYTSPNLLDWTFTDHTDFGRECLDLIELPVEGDNRMWVMHDAAGNYLIGQFDGRTFTKEHGPYPMDLGPGFYVPQTFNEETFPDNRVIQISWMGGWGADRLGSVWTGCATFPVRLELENFSQGLRLTRTPIEEIENLYISNSHWEDEIVSPGTNLLENLNSKCFDISAEFDLDGTTATQFGFDFANRSVTYDVDTGKLLGENLNTPDNRVKIRILVDRSSLEVFGDEGEFSWTEKFGFTPSDDSLELWTEGGDVELVSMEFHKIRPIWGNHPLSAPTGLSASAVGSSQIDLDWDDNPENDLSHYNVYRDNVSGFSVRSDQYVVDSSVEGNDGTLGPASVSESSDPTRTTSGYSGSALDFDGSNDYVRDSNPSNLPIGDSDRTVMAWVYPNPSGTAPTDLGNIVSYGSGRSNNEVWRIAYDQNDKRTEGDLGVIGGFNDVKWYGDLKEGTWSLVAATYDSSASEVEIYVNGTSVGTGTPSDYATTQAYLDVGRRPQDLGEMFYGKIDDARIYTRALSKNEIDNLYNGNSVDNSGLVGWWEFDTPENNLIGSSSVSEFVDSGLVENTTYYYRVTAVDNSGNESDASSEVSATTESAAGDTVPPADFDLVSPLDGTTVRDNTPTLEWESSSDDESGLDHYEVWVDGTNVENVPVGTTGYTTSVLSDGSHEWKIVAVDGAGNERQSESVFNFTVKVGKPWFVDEDSTVGLSDLMIVSYHYGESEGSPGWLPSADVDGSGKVGLSDLMTVAYHYGETR